MNRKKKKWIVLAAVCCVAVVAVVVIRANGKRNDMAEMAMGGSKTAAVERRTLTESISATGKIASIDSKTVTASVTGVKVMSVDVKVGDVVKEGDVLCVLDSSTLEQNLADTKTSLDSTQAKNQLSISSAQRSLEEAQASRNIELERADVDVGKAWSDYQEAVTAQQNAESAYNQAKNATAGKLAELQSSQEQLAQAQQKMANTPESQGKSGECESGFQEALQGLSAYAQANNLTLKSGDISLAADLSALSAGSLVEENTEDIEGWETISAELENYLGTLRDWQNKYQEAAAADLNWQNAKAEYERLQQEVSARQQEYAAAQQNESANASAYENAVSTAKSRLEAYDQKVRSKEDTVRNNDSTVKSRNETLQNSVRDAAVSGMSDRQKIREYEEQIAACTVKAPMSGVVTSVSVVKGDSYSGGAIAVIEDNSDYEVTAEIDEYDIGKVRVGQEAVIRTNGTGDTEFKGKVKDIAPRATSSGTGSNVTYRVSISIDMPSDEMKMDMTAKLNIVLNSVDNALTVPVDALQEDDDGSYYVEVVKKDAAGTDGWPGMGTDGEEPGGAAGGGTAKTPGQESAGTGTEGNGENVTEPEWQKPESETAFGGKGKWDGAEMQAPQTEKITVQKGLESDYYVEIISKAIEVGMEVVVPTADNQDIQSMMQQMGPMGGF